MTLTPKLKSWALKNTPVEPSDNDDQFKKAIADALITGELTAEKFKDLSLTAEDTQAEEFRNTLKGFGDVLQELKDTLLEEKNTRDPKKVTPGMEDDPSDMPVVDEVNKENQNKELEDYSSDDEGNAIDTNAKPKKSTKEAGKADEKPAGEKSTKAQKPSGEKQMPRPSALESMVVKASMYTESFEDYDTPGETKGISIRVKEAADQYDNTKTALLYPSTTQNGKSHPLAGRPVKDFSDPQTGGRNLNTASDLDKAVSGAFIKFECNHARVKSRNIAFSQMPQHDKELLLYGMQNMLWGGSSDGGDFADIKDRRLTPGEQKALIDDSASGGVTAAPLVFDDQVIQTPLLNGELFPLVNQVPLDRGRRIEGVATAVVTGSWGGVDDTAIALFDTTSYVTAFDTTVFRWQGAFRIGLDFLSDTPIDFGQYVTAQYGERLLKDLDDVIATGNGSTQPEGVMVHAGTTSVNFGGTTTLSNYESLRFGVTKQEHRANLVSSAVFCGTEISYMRAKAIPVGAADARRLSNTVSMPDYNDYMWMQRPYKINSSLTNSQIFYAILARYRMYRRRGMTVRTSSEGDTLIRANSLLMVATARYGGQCERGAIAAITSSAPA